MEQTVRARVVRIGNSRGIRIPKVWLDQLNLGDEVELAVRQDSLVVRRAHSPREGWAGAFQAMAKNRDDSLIDQPRATEWDRKEWTW
ncbi:MAG TPA: AbrB/MazE/SpoVT family DNA-binding domain-containing protein [Anaerolineales bacterium]|nr:AbrB/MazE/SpoVT family DNA-binding domain-containing protein [Anaerolineales bacterium]